MLVIGAERCYATTFIHESVSKRWARREGARHDEGYNMKKQVRKRIFFAVTMIILFLFSCSLPVTAEDPVCSSYEDLYRIMIADTLGWKRTAEYRTTFKPDKLSLDRIKEGIAETDYILSHCLYAFSWEYERIPGTDTVYVVKTTYEYYMDRREREKVEEMCEMLAQELSDKSDYEKIKAVHDHIILNCEYSLFSNGPYNCLYNGKACCNGYALAFQMIMDSCDVECQYVTSTNHAWNTVCLDGVWYNMDLTWDDGEGKEVLYTNFLKSNAEFPDHPGANATAVLSYPVDGVLDQEIIMLNSPVVVFVYRYWYVGLFLVFAIIYVASNIYIAKVEEKTDKKTND